MHKLVIVDDEYLVRLGIRETIDWAANGIEVIGDASNGKQGYEMIKELNPDLVITDIKMPIMNGVDLVKTLHKEGFNGEIVVLSGYKDFEYAKETFENGILSIKITQGSDGDYNGGDYKVYYSKDNGNSWSLEK